MEDTGICGRRGGRSRCQSALKPVRVPAQRKTKAARGIKILLDRILDQLTDDDITCRSPHNVPFILETTVMSTLEYAVFSHVGESSVDSLNKLEKVFFKYPERCFLHKFARTIVQLFQQSIRLFLTGER